MVRNSCCSIEYPILTGGAQFRPPSSTESPRSWLKKPIRRRPARTRGTRPVRVSLAGINRHRRSSYLRRPVAPRGLHTVRFSCTNKLIEIGMTSGQVPTLVSDGFTSASAPSHRRGLCWAPCCDSNPPEGTRALCMKH
eukprot:gene10892-biopygen1798